VKVISRGVTEAQEARVGLFRCPDCTSLVEFSLYDLPRWSVDDGLASARCPVCGGSIPETASCGEERA
jgi:hypothetical protein